METQLQFDTGPLFTTFAQQKLSSQLDHSYLDSTYKITQTLFAQRKEGSIQAKEIHARQTLTDRYTCLLIATSVLHYIHTSFLCT